MKQQPLIRQSIEMPDGEVTYWKSELRSSMKRQKEEFTTRIGYEANIRYLEGLQVAEGAKINQMAIVDEVSPAILSVVTDTYNQNPSVVVKASHPDADGMVKPQMLYLLQHPDFVPFKLADLMEGSIKYGMDKVGMKEEMQLADMDLMLAGFCAVEMNFLSEPAKDQPMQDTAQPETNIIDSILGVAKNAIGAVKDALTKDETEEKIATEVQDEKVDFSDVTYCKRWNPLDILFDSKAVVFKDSRFIAKIIRMSLAEFNTKYPKFKGKLTPGSALTSDISYQSHLNPEFKKAITLYQIEIKKKGERNCQLIVAEGVDEAIDYWEDPIITNNFKIKYGAIDKYGKIYPMSRATKARKPQDDINHYMTVQFEHIDRAMRKIGVYMQGLTPAGQAAMRSSDVYALVEKLGPQAVFEVMPAPQVVPENKEVIMKLTDSINKAIGSSELRKSGKSENELLGQDQIANEAFQSNAGAVTDALQDISNELLDTLKDIIMQTWDGEDYFKVTGITGGDQWYSPDMGPLADLLIGDYSVKTDITTAAKPNPQKDKQDAIAYSEFMTNPLTVQFAAMHGKRPSMNALNNVVKQFGQSPEIAFEDLQPMLPPGMPPQQGQLPQQAPIPVPQQGAQQSAHL